MKENRVEVRHDDSRMDFKWVEGRLYQREDGEVFICSRARGGVNKTLTRIVNLRTGREIVWPTAALFAPLAEGSEIKVTVGGDG